MNNATSTIVAKPLDRYAGLQPLECLSDGFVLIDGLNLARVGGRSPRLEILLAAALYAAQAAGDFGCVFDANTRYLLQEAQGPASVEAYCRLLREYGDFFVEVTGGTRADDLILAEAAARNARILSNDRFGDYPGDHFWLREPGRVIRANLFRGHLHVGPCRLPVCANLKDAMSELQAVLNAMR